MNFRLSDSERKLLESQQKSEKHKQDYVKITVLLNLDRGRTVQEISEILGIDDATVYRYVSVYQQKGLAHYLGNHYRGFWGKLDSRQLVLLQEELNRHLYTESKSIVEWVKNNFGVFYTPEGILPLLHRLGFA